MKTTLHSRRGMADLIVMILMIVLLLGVSVLAFMAFDRAKKEEMYLGRLREIPASQRAEMAATKARFAQVSNLIGFKGNADYSSPTAIKDMLERGGERNGAFLRIESPNAEDKNSALKNVTGTHQVSGLPRVVGTRDAKVNIYAWKDGITVLEAIAAQDNLIQDLVRNYIPTMQKQVELQRKWKEEANTERKTATDAKFADFAVNREASDSSLKERITAAIGQEEAMTDAAKREITAYDELSGAAIQAAVEDKFKKMRDTLPARDAASKRADEFHKKDGRRHTDDQRAPDGYVFLVDNVSGWVWINIGQKSDVRLEMSFQVLRADPALPSLLPVGEIRVKEILKGNIARCRVDALDDPANLPRQGDLIRNPNFNDRQYFSYCLVGKFGGSSSKMTHQQWVTKLSEMGFRVVPTIEGDTDVAVLGEDWINDPIFVKATKEEGLEFERMTEKELMWFLGLDGPESK